MVDLSNVIRILPPMKSGDDLFSALEVLPEYDEDCHFGDAMGQKIIGVLGVRR